VKLTRAGYDEIHSLVFRDDYSGYSPSTLELPNGDGAVDIGKRYAHVSPKHATGNDRLLTYYREALKEAVRVCEVLNVPRQYYPGPDSTMRVLEYPAGAGSAPHTDFDLFTLSLFREPEEGFRFLPHETPGAVADESYEYWTRVNKKFPVIHFGELWTLVTGELANPHEVIPLNVAQRAVVFFVVPDHEARLPSGQYVGDWIRERKERSRKVDGGYS